MVLWSATASPLPMPSGSMRCPRAPQVSRRRLLALRLLRRNFASRGAVPRHGAGGRERPQMFLAPPTATVTCGLITVFEQLNVNRSVEIFLWPSPSTTSGRVFSMLLHRQCGRYPPLWLPRPSFSHGRRPAMPPLLLPALNLGARCHQKAALPPNGQRPGRPR